MKRTTRRKIAESPVGKVGFVLAAAALAAVERLFGGAWRWTRETRSAIALRVIRRDSTSRDATTRRFRFTGQPVATRAPFDGDNVDEMVAALEGLRDHAA